MAQHSTASPALPEREAAPYLGYRPAALRVWRRENRGPAYVRHGRSVRYLVKDLDAFLERHRVVTTEAR